MHTGKMATDKNAGSLIKVAVQACDHETTRHTKAYLIQTRSADGNKLYIK